MKKIALIGAGGHCKVVIDLIEELNQYEIIGIYDDNKEGFFENIKILGNLDCIDKKIENFFICIGNDKIRKRDETRIGTYRSALLRCLCTPPCPRHPSSAQPGTHHGLAPRARLKGDAAARRLRGAALGAGAR